MLTLARVLRVPPEWLKDGAGSPPDFSEEAALEQPATPVPRPRDYALLQQRLSDASRTYGVTDGSDLVAEAHAILDAIQAGHDQQLALVQRIVALAKRWRVP